VNSAAITNEPLRNFFKSRFRLTTAHYENNIAVLSRRKIRETELRERLQKLKSDKIAINRSTLSLKIRNIA